jgi:hypothetical protein
MVGPKEGLLPNRDHEARPRPPIEAPAPPFVTRKRVRNGVEMVMSRRHAGFSGHWERHVGHDSGARSIAGSRPGQTLDALDVDA